MALVMPFLNHWNTRLSLLAASVTLVGLTFEWFQSLNIGLVLGGFNCLLIGCLIFLSALNSWRRWRFRSRLADPFGDAARPPRSLQDAQTRTGPCYRPQAT